MRSPITTHVLDLVAGKPAANIPVKLDRNQNGSFEKISDSKTNSDGRVEDLLKSGTQVESGEYRLTFETDAYFGEKKSFYGSIEIRFRVENPSEHYHVPLLLSSFGYSTYRGS